MLTKLKNSSLSKGISSIGIDVHVKSDDHVVYNIVKLVKNKNIVKLIYQEHGIESIDEIKSHIDYDTSVTVSLGGKGVLNKCTDSQDDITPKSIISSFLPNAKSSEFFIQIARLNSQKIIVSLCRKESVEKILAEFTETGISIYDVQLGSCQLINTNSYVFFRDNFVLDSIEFSVSEGAISSTQNCNADTILPTIVVDDEQVDQECTKAYCNALTFFTSNNSEVSASESLNNFREEYQFKVLLKKVGIAMMAVLFSALLLNYLLFNNANNKLNSATDNLQYKKNILYEIQSLKSDISKKESLLKESGFLSATCQAYLVDQIAASKPSQIQLTRLALQPITSEILEEERLSFQNDIIIIEGKARHSKELKNWIIKLKKKSWNSDVEMIKYDFDQNKKIGKFKLEITLDSK